MPRLLFATVVLLPNSKRIPSQELGIQPLASTATKLARDDDKLLVVLVASAFTIAMVARIMAKKVVVVVVLLLRIVVVIVGRLAPKLAVLV